MILPGRVIAAFCQKKVWQSKDCETIVQKQDHYAGLWDRRQIQRSELVSRQGAILCVGQDFGTGLGDEDGVFKLS